MNDQFFKVVDIGLVAVIEALLANDRAKGVLTTLINEGRETLNAEEIAAMDAESEAAHADLRAAIDKARAEGR